MITRALLLLGALVGALVLVAPRPSASVPVVALATNCLSVTHTPVASELLVFQRADAPDGPWTNLETRVAPLDLPVTFSDCAATGLTGFARVVELAPSTAAVTQVAFRGGSPAASFCKSLRTVHENGRTYRYRENW
jgi:hypothetical protein